MTDFGSVNRNAVAVGCDKNYLPFALFLLWQIHSLSPHRRFDLILVTEGSEEIPDSLSTLGIKHHKLQSSEQIDTLPEHRLSRAGYMRLFIAGELGHAYSRLLYLDSDMFFEGADLNRLFTLDLGSSALAAVQDVPVFYEPSSIPHEFKVLGVGKRRYFNSGFLLIDCSAWQTQELTERCMGLAILRPDIFAFRDQSLLNGVIQGDFAELSPVWNWMSSVRYATLDHRMAPIFHHFVSDRKPWTNNGHQQQARFAAAYRFFFENFMPGEDVRMNSLVRSDPHGFGDLGRRLLAQIRERKPIDRYLSRFADEWTVLPAQPSPGMGGLRT